MDRRSKLSARSIVALIILVVATVGLTACKDADHWIVIHDRVEFTGGTGGGPNICEPPAIGQNITYLPVCLKVEKDQKIGFYNFTKEKITVEHFNSLNAPTTFDVEPGKTKIFKVVVQGTLVQFNFKTTLDHGGPEMIVEP